MRAQLLVIGATLAVAVGIALAGPPAARGFALSDAGGTLRSPEEWRGRAAVVLLFVAVDCPISNRYAPTINALAKEFGARNVGFYGVHSDPDIQAAEIRTHATDYGFEFPMLLDPGQDLASRFGVTATPTAVVASAAGQLLYRGRIDDRAVDFGKWRDTPRSEDLRNAVAAVLAGRAVAEPFPEPVGCYLPSLRSKR